MRRILLLLLGIALVLLYLSIQGIGAKREALSNLGKVNTSQLNENKSSLNSRSDSRQSLPNKQLSKLEPTFEELLQSTSGSGNDSPDRISDEGEASGVVVHDSQADKGGLYYSGGSASGSQEQTNTGGSSPELDALREIARLNRNASGSSLIPGIHVRRTPTPSDNRAAILTPAATATPSNKLSLVGGQARGYTMLYLMHPKARQTVERQLDAMLRANVEELYLGVLTDGTFTRDINYLTNVVRRIGRAGKALTLVLYLSNGPAMRNFNSTERSSAPFSGVNPSDFRFLIRDDLNTREEFVRIVRPLNAVLQLNKRLNDRSRSFVIVMLEDNLDDDSYLSMRRLAQGVIGTRATFIRNPCPGCWEGNTSSGLGDGVELHDPVGINELTSSDGFSLDGKGYALPGETNSNELSYEQARDLLVTSESRGLLYFGLWRHSRQGLIPGIIPPHPDERTYEVPSESDLDAEIELLRAGLVELP